VNLAQQDTTRHDTARHDSTRHDSTRQESTRHDSTRQDSTRTPGFADRRSSKPRRGGPLRAVLTALAAGATNLDEVAERTGLDRGVVSAAVAHLARSGHLRTGQLASGCPEAGCASCGSRPTDTDTDTDVDAGRRGPGSRTRGPVLITLACHPPSS
jgi:hypothetical protein